MTLEAIIVVLLIGAIAGWLGSVIFKGSGLGLPGNIVVGILGSFVGSWLLGKLKYQYWRWSPTCELNSYRSNRCNCNFISIKPYL